MRGSLRTALDLFDGYVREHGLPLSTTAARAIAATYWRRAENHGNPERNGEWNRRAE